MDLHITFDISDKLTAALGRLAIAIEAVKVCAASTAHSETVECPAKSAEIAPVAQIEPKQAIAQSEPETVKTEPVLAQSEPIQEPAANDNAEETPKAEPEPVKKPVKKKAVKKAEIAPAAQVEAEQTIAQPEQTIVQPEPKTVKTEPVLAQSEPESAKTEETSKATDDGMAGMNLMEASRQLIEDIQDAGIEMADANARVRAKANELGLSFGSITCLIKAIGYVEAKKVAIGK